MPQNCEPGGYQDGFVLRTKKVWFQKEVALVARPSWCEELWIFLAVEKGEYQRTFFKRDEPQMEIRRRLNCGHDPAFEHGRSHAEFPIGNAKL
jgi:hypothetical protein